MTLRRNFELAANQSKFTRRVPGLMGRKDDAVPTYTFTVPGGQGYTYVRVGDGSSSALAVAFNRGGVALTGDLKVWVDIDSDGRATITELRY
jgi:hypothetical protein